MKKLLLALIVVPGLAFADEFCIYNFTKGRCEGAYSPEVSGLNFCAPYTEGDIGELLYSICDDGFFFASAYSTCSTGYNELSASYTKVQKNLNDCVAYSSTQASTISSCNAKVNSLTIDYNSLVTKCNATKTQHDSLATDYDALSAKCANNEASRQEWIAYGTAQATLAKRLRKACGSKCKKIK